ncbi:glycosyltransferase family 2 protein [Candidatus Margulisiibacteriota bacterium]
MPKVSFVCSVYNAGEYLEPFLRSIQGQELTDYECIFVDADSNDGTRELLHKYSQLDKHFKLMGERFITIAKAVNIGLRVAKGDYIARIDADNLLFPSFLSDQINFLEKNKNIDFVIADQLKIDAKNKVLGMIPFLITDYALKKHLLFKTALGGAPMVGRKQAFFDVGLYEESTVITEDRIFALKAMGQKKFASLNKINYAYRIHAEAITRRYKKTKEHQAKVKEYENKYVHTEDYINDLKQYQDIFEKEYLFKELILKKIANTLLYCGLRLADLGQNEAGKKEIEKAKQVFPKNKLIYDFFSWRSTKGTRHLEELARKIDYWLPFKIDLLQLVPLKIWQKSIHSEQEKQEYIRIMNEYAKLLHKVYNK